MFRRALVGVGIGLAAALVALLLRSTELVGRLEDATYDLRVRQMATPVPVPSRVAVVEIDESTIRRLEPQLGRWPWPRLVHALLIDYLTLGGAKAIVYDVIFAEEHSRTTFEIGGQRVSGEESDDRLVDAVRKAGNVILAADPTSEGLQSTRAENVDAPVLPGVVFAPGDEFQERMSMTPPFPRLMRAAAGIGHTMLVRETDGSARRALPFITNRGVAVPALGLAGALFDLGLGPDDVRLEGRVLRLGDVRMPLLDVSVPASQPGGTPLPSRQVLLRFPAPRTGADQVRALVPTYSAHDVLVSSDNISSGTRPLVDPSAFKDRIVFVGIRIANTNEQFTTPFGGEEIYGVELHAVLAHNILERQFMRRSTIGADAALTGAAALAGGLIAAMVPAVWATVIVVALVGGLAAWLTWLVGQDVWAGLATPVIGAAIALFSGVAWQYLVEGRAKRQVRQLFGQYVSKDVIAQLMDDPTQARLGGQRREMTVLFSDIRGFTSASEKSTPEDVVLQLNEYFSAMVDVLFRHQGTLDKFVGDMVMGLFGAPLLDPRHADHAVAAAREMVVELQRLNDGWRQDGRPELDIGIGVNTGPMIAGNIGSVSIMSYTVIGDSVNLGSRIESLNKDYGTRILISGETRAALTTPVELREVDTVKVKGRSKPVTIYEVK